MTARPWTQVVVADRERRTETLEVDGRLQRHVEGCRCTTLHMWWPCEDVTP